MINYKLYIMNKLVIIIVRYTESIEWIKQLNKNYEIIIYNKGDQINEVFKQNIRIKNIENTGRESEGYLRFMIEEYNNIDDKVYYVFLQADPFEHCKNIINKLKHLSELNCLKNFVHLGDLNCLDLDEVVDYNNLRTNFVNQIINLENFEKDNDKLLCNVILDEHSRFKTIKENFVNQSKHRQEIRNTHIDKVRQIYNWSEGALFAVAGVNISTNKIEFYKNLKDSLLACKETDLGFLYERYWCLFIMN